MLKESEMRTKKGFNILLFELPQLCVLEKATIEHLRLAETYLSWAILNSRLKEKINLYSLSKRCYLKDDKSILKAILRITPDILITTLYVWNVERTVKIIHDVKKMLPNVVTIGGGPEVADDNDFLLNKRCFDFLVIGEGENILPEIIKLIIDGNPLSDKQCLLYLGKDNKYHRGNLSTQPVSLAAVLPPANYKRYYISENGMAYVEVSRGCPMSCSFCRYNQVRKTYDFLPLDIFADRLSILIKRKAKELRFIDPTLSAYKYYKNLLAILVNLNKRFKLKIFAELNAEQIDYKTAILMKKAGFNEVEVGLQSVDSLVLNSVHRPTNIRLLRRGIKNMIKAGIKVIVDVMIGLPYQTAEDVIKSVRWVKSIKGAKVQVLHTLCLPGTLLRKHSKRLGIKFINFPPYFVTESSHLKSKEIIFLYEKLCGLLKEKAAFQTKKFVFRDLDGDVFRERVIVNLSHFVDNLSRTSVVNNSVRKILKGSFAHRAVIFYSNEMFQKRKVIGEIIEKVVLAEPHIFWEFILYFEEEEPLDLLDYLIEKIKTLPSHISDRWLEFETNGKIVSRRVFVLLRRYKHYRLDWVNALEELLSSHFY